MSEQKVSVGRIVHYRLSADDVAALDRRRKNAGSSGLKKAHLGIMLHVGNSGTVGQILPAMVVSVWPDQQINAQVFCDGNDTLWVTTVSRGDKSGQWDWPGRA